MDLCRPQSTANFTQTRRFAARFAAHPVTWLRGLCRAIQTLGLVVALGVSASSLAQNATAPEYKLGPQRVDQVEAELVLAPSAVDPRQALQLRVGIRLKHDEHWHTYWRNPGDSGLATQLNWTLPEGWKAGPIQWPAPTRIGLAHLANYGYEGHIVLPVVLTAPNTTALDQPQTLKVHAQWLVCKDVCIPGEAHLQLSFPGRSKVSQANAQTAELFRRADALRPAAGPDGQLDRLSATLTQNASGPVLEIDFNDPARAAWLKSVSQLEFFPYAEAWVRPAAVQRFQSMGNRLRIYLTKGDGPAQLEQSLGLLKLDERYLEVVSQQWPLPNPLPQSPSDWNSPSAQWVSEVSHFVKTKSNQLPGSLASQPGKASSPISSTGSVSTSPSVTPSLGLLAALALAFAGGVLLNLMPCVLPVLSIKLLQVVQSGVSRHRSHALGFAVGVIISFLALGLGLWLLRSAGEAVGWGFQLQSPWFVAALSAVFLLLALNMLGVFEVGSSVMQWAQPQSSAAAADRAQDAANNRPQASIFQSLASGVLAVVAATPCSAPFMGSALGYAISQPLIGLLLVFFMLGLGMALPFTLLLLVPGLRRFVPKPGRWMLLFKQFLAFPLFATVAWLLWVLVLQTDATVLLWTLLSLVSLAALAWLYGGWQLRRWSRKGVFASVLAITASALLWGVTKTYQSVGDSVGDFQRSPQAAPGKQPSGTRLNTAASGDGWQPYSDAAVQLALARGSPVFIDFTAAWCVSCQVNKSVVLNDSKMMEFFRQNNVQLFRADWTRRDPEITRALAQLGRNAVPVYVAYSAGSRTPQLLPEILDAASIKAAYVQSSAKSQ